jgi:hypothetical protein
MKPLKCSTVHTGKKVYVSRRSECLVGIKVSKKGSVSENVRIAGDTNVGRIS